MTACAAAAAGRPGRACRGVVAKAPLADV